MPCMQVQEAAERIRLEYADMPELKLTFWQAQRLWHLSAELCERALTRLMSDGFLVRSGDGRYMRPSRERRACPAMMPHAVRSDR